MDKTDKHANHDETWVEIPDKVVSDPSLSATARLLYGVVQNLARKKGFCHANNTYLARRLGGCAKSTISRSLGELADAGCVKREEDSDGKRRLHPLIAVGKKKEPEAEPDTTDTEEDEEGYAISEGGHSKNETGASHFSEGGHGENETGPSCFSEGGHSKNESHISISTIGEGGVLINNNNNNGSADASPEDSSDEESSLLSLINDLKKEHSERKDELEDLDREWESKPSEWKTLEEKKDMHVQQREELDEQLCNVARDIDGKTEQLQLLIERRKEAETLAELDSWQDDPENAITRDPSMVVDAFQAACLNRVPGLEFPSSRESQVRVAEEVMGILERKGRLTELVLRSWLAWYASRRISEKSFRYVITLKSLAATWYKFSDQWDWVFTMQGGSTVESRTRMRDAILESRKETTMRKDDADEDESAGEGQSEDTAAYSPKTSQTLPEPPVDRRGIGPQPDKDGGLLADRGWPWMT